MKKRFWKLSLCGIVLVLLLFTACSSKAAKAVEKVELGQKYLTELNYTEAVAYRKNGRTALYAGRSLRWTC